MLRYSSITVALSIDKNLTVTQCNKKIVIFLFLVLFYIFTYRWFRIDIIFQESKTILKSVHKKLRYYA